MAPGPPDPSTTTSSADRPADCGSACTRLATNANRSAARRRQFERLTDHRQWFRQLGARLLYQRPVPVIALLKPGMPVRLTGYTRPKRTIDMGRAMKAILLASSAACASILLSALSWSAVHSSTPASIDGTYELTERVMASGAVLRSPSIAGLYTQAAGRFNLNIFVKKADGTIASESTVGRFTFSADKYCEWIIYTIRKDLDTPGVTNEAPPIGDHCALVTSKDGRFNFSPRGEGVEVSYGSEGFTASIGGDFVDHWKKIR